MATSTIFNYSEYGNKMLYDNTLTTQLQTATIFTHFNYMVPVDYFDQNADGGSMDKTTGISTSIEFRPTDAGNDYEPQKVYTYTQVSKVTHYELCYEESKISMSRLELRISSNKAAKVNEANRARNILPIKHLIRTLNANSTGMIPGSPLTSITQATVEAMIDDAQQKLFYGADTVSAGHNGLTAFMDSSIYRKLMSSINSQATKTVVIRNNMLAQGNISEIDPIVAGITNSFRRGHLTIEDVYGCYIVAVNPVVSLRMNYVTNTIKPKFEDVLGRVQNGATTENYIYLTYLHNTKIVGFTIALGTTEIREVRAFSNNDTTRYNHSTAIRTMIDRNAIVKVLVS